MILLNTYLLNYPFRVQDGQNLMSWRNAFHQLMVLSPATWKTFDNIVSQQVRQQIKTLLQRKDLVFPVFNGSKSVRE